MSRPRTLRFAVAGALALGLAACGGGATPTPAPTVVPTPAPTPAPTATPAAVDVAKEFLARLLANPVTNGWTWQFLKAHWDELAPKALNFLGGASLGSALGSFCDPQARDDIQAFFRTHRLTSGDRALAQSIEQINGCIALRQAQTSGLTTWLASQAR